MAPKRSISADTVTVSRDQLRQLVKAGFWAGFETARKGPDVADSWENSALRFEIDYRAGLTDLLEKKG